MVQSIGSHNIRINVSTVNFFFPGKTFLTIIRSSTYIQLVDGYYGNGTSVTTQLPHKHKLVDVPQDAGLVLQDNRWNETDKQ